MNNSNMDSLGASLKAHFENKKFDEAIELVLKNKNGMKKTVFHYNLGTLYANKGELAIARYHLEKSLGQASSIPIVKSNLKTVKSKLGLTSKVSSYEKLDQFGFLIKDISFDYYLIISLLIFLVFLYSLIKRVKIIVVVFMALLSFSILGTGIYSDRYLVNGIILGEGAVRTGPSSVYPAFMDIKKGQRVIIGKSFDGWLKVVMPRSSGGWINKKDIGLY